MTYHRAAASALLLLLAGSAQAQLTATGNQLFLSTQLSGGLNGNLDFASALTSGDFDCDGFDDAAIGSPNADANGVAGAGQVLVLYGAATGLSASRSEAWSQSSPGVPGGSETDDAFGSALAAGKLSSDNCDDLAIGTPGEDLSNPPFNSVNSGAVTALLGGTSGLTSTGASFFPDSSDSGDDGIDQFDGVGSALAIGSVLQLGNSFDELVTGIPNDKRGLVAPRSGSIDIRRAPPAPAGARVGRFDQDVTVESDEEDDRFGAALAIGDFDNDGVRDIAIGAPGESVSNDISTGAVTILYGSAPPFGAGGSLVLDQDTAGVPGANETDDEFGSSLAAGDFDGDGGDDLAIGVPLEDIGSGFQDGMVIIAYGDPNGVNRLDRFIAIDLVDAGLATGGTSGADSFGQGLATGDFNGDGFADLAVGGPGAPSGLGGIESGAVVVFYGAASGLSAARRQLWHMDIVGVAGAARASDLFGSALTSGDFNGDRVSDLLIGIPRRDSTGLSDNIGGVLVLYGSLPTLLINGFE